MGKCLSPVRDRIPEGTAMVVDESVVWKVDRRCDTRRVVTAALLEEIAGHVYGTDVDTALDIARNWRVG